jgi:hypothetical protein
MFCLVLITIWHKIEVYLNSLEEEDLMNELYDTEVSKHFRLHLLPRTKFAIVASPFASHYHLSSPTPGL